jgi:putative peptide zinc metalloprotease protein
MSAPLFSQSWHRVSQLRPKLRPHAQIHRHHYRGKRWYVLQDHATGAFHRFMPSAHFMIGLMNGERTVQEIWEASLAKLHDDAPTQDELIELLAQLHSADVLLCDVTPDGLELFDRFNRKQSARRTQRWSSPLALKFPLVDPDRILDRLAPFVRPLFGWVGAITWLAVVVTAAVLAVTHWPELTENVTDRVLTPHNLVLLALTYPLIKLFHELGHALTTKIWGGEVHEMGIMLLVLVPIPYVDASAASAFRSRRRRVIVGSAGIIVELFLAGLALFAWLNIEAGMLRAAAYNVMIIGGVSTLLINGNPLLRFDGYYILADLLEIPNLAQRSQRHLRYLADRYLFGVEGAEPLANAPGEATWFGVYGVASFVYRIFLFSAIILFIAGKFFVIGLLLAAWASFGLVVRPLYKAARYVFADPRLQKRRVRAVAVAAGLVAAAVLLLVVPAPSSTRAEGVVWIAEDSIVRAEVDGFIAEVLAEPGTRVSAGQPLVTTHDPKLAADVEILELRVEELRSREAALRVSDQVAAEIARQDLLAANAELERTRERHAALTIRARREGTLVLTRARDLPGRFLKKGQVLGYVLDLSTVTARIVVTQANVDLVRRQTVSVSARLTENLNETPARILREVPGASDRLPSNMLGTVGGGQIAIDPRLQGGDTALQTLFQFDIELLPERSLATVGGRVHVRFDHGNVPIAQQLYRSLRQLLLRRFRV